MPKNPSSSKSLEIRGSLLSLSPSTDASRLAPYLQISNFPLDGLIRAYYPTSSQPPTHVLKKPTHFVPAVTINRDPVSMPRVQSVPRSGLTGFGMNSQNVSELLYTRHSVFHLGIMSCWFIEPRYRRQINPRYIGRRPKGPDTHLL
jgi:hypothetical protein